MSKKRILYDVRDASFRYIDDGVVQGVMLPLGAPLPGEYYRAIGRIAVNCSTLEGSIAAYVGQLLSTDQFLGQIVTAEIGFKQHMTMLHGLIKHKIPDNAQRQSVTTLLKQASTAVDKRNMIVHSEWSPKGQDGKITRIKFTAKVKHGLKHTFNEVSVEEVEAIADEIWNVHCDLKMIFCPPDINVKSLKK